MYAIPIEELNAFSATKEYRPAVEFTLPRPVGQLSCFTTRPCNSADAVPCVSLSTGSIHTPATYMPCRLVKLHLVYPPHHWFKLLWRLTRRHSQSGYVRHDLKVGAPFGRKRSQYTLCHLPPSASAVYM